MIQNSTIFDEMIHNAETEIRALRQKIEELKREDDRLCKSIEDSRAWLKLPNIPWNEKAETEADIRYDETIRQQNWELIKKYESDIKEIQTQIQQAIKMQNSGKRK